MRMKVSFEGMEVKPGDVVVIRPQTVEPQYRIKDLYDTAKLAFPNHLVVIMFPEYEIKTYDKNEFMEFLESLKKLVEGSKTE